MDIDINTEALRSLKQALRYIEVKMAYQGDMTAAQVEAQIEHNRNIARTEIGANSVSTLAIVDIDRMREVILLLERETRQSTYGHDSGGTRV